MAVTQDEMFDKISPEQAAETGDTTPPDGADASQEASRETGQEAEASGETGEAASQKDEDQGNIPYAAMKKEREKWQARMAGMEEKLSKYDQLEGKLNQFYANQETKDLDASTPDYDENPAEYLRIRQERMEKQQDKMSENLSEYDKQREQQAQMQQIGTAISADEQRFVKEKPDYNNALQFVRDREMQRIKMAGYDDTQAMQALSQMEFQIGAQMINQQQSPAEYIYNMAKWYGYKNEASAAAEEKIDQLEDGMKASKTLGSGGAPNLEDIEKLPMSEFDTAMREMFG